MASLWSKIFGGTEKRDTTYTGPKPYGSLREAEGGQLALDTLKSRLAGNAGYGEDFVNRASNPLINSMRYRFKSNTIPELQSILSAQGRREGSGGFEQLKQALLDQNAQEDSAYSNIYMTAENQKRNEINQALQDIQKYSANDANLRAGLAQFENANNNRQISEEDQRLARQGAGLQNLIFAGSDLFSSLMGGGSAPFQRQPQYSMPFQYGNQANYGTPPPYGYDYSNLSTPNSTRKALQAALGGFR